MIADSDKVNEFLHFSEVHGLLSDRGLADEVRRAGSGLVEKYIAALPWSAHATENDKALVAGNLRTFWNWLHINSRGRILADHAAPTEGNGVFTQVVALADAVKRLPMDQRGRRIEEQAMFVLDAWDDGQLQPETRCYVEGTFRESLEGLRSLLAEPATPSQGNPA